MCAHSISYAVSYAVSIADNAASPVEALLTSVSCESSICDNDGRLCHQQQSVAKWLQDNATVASLGCDTSHTLWLPCAQQFPSCCHPCCQKKEVAARQEATVCVICWLKKQQQ